MFTKSIWNSFSKTTDFPSLNKNIKTEVAIIGGGITGLTTALELSKAGVECVVLEKSKVGAGTTSHSTGNLYATVDKQLDALLSKYDSTTITEMMDARAAAVDQVEEYVRQFELDCDFKRTTWYLFSNSEKKDELISKEAKQSKEVMIPVSWATAEEIPFPVSKAMKA